MHFKPTHVYHFGGAIGRLHQPNGVPVVVSRYCGAGFYEWTTETDNLAGQARMDGVKNSHGSYVTVLQ